MIEGLFFPQIVRTQVPLEEETKVGASDSEKNKMMTIDLKSAGSRTIAGALERESMSLLPK